MKTIIFCILTLSILPSAFAGGDPPTSISDHDVTCHTCRISKNRLRVTTVHYYNCGKCSKSYCANCVDKDASVTPTKNGCLYCQNECCCQKECSKDHVCCHTSKRTKKRHALNPEMKSYKKAKIEKENQDVVEIQTEDSNLCCELEIEPSLPQYQPIITIEPLNAQVLETTQEDVIDLTQEFALGPTHSIVFETEDLIVIHPGLSVLQIQNLIQANMVNIHFLPLGAFLPPWSLTYPYFPNLNWNEVQHLFQSTPNHPQVHTISLL